jgi:hypothetical protein
MWHRVLTGAAILLTVPAVASADDYRCTQGEMVRRVEIMYEPGLAVPCEVHYFKDTEAPGTREVLWRAQNEAGYCEARTEELIAMLKSYGWECTSGTTDELLDDVGDEPAAPEIDSH